jgi:hypothetical protein
MHEVCEESQILQKNLKKYPLTLPSFLESNNTTDDECDSLEFKIAKIKTKSKDIYYRYVVLKHEITGQKNVHKKVLVSCKCKS